MGPAEAFFSWKSSSSAGRPGSLSSTVVRSLSGGRVTLQRRPARPPQPDGAVAAVDAPDRVQEQVRHLAVPDVRLDARQADPLQGLAHRPSQAGQPCTGAIVDDHQHRVEAVAGLEEAGGTGGGRELARRKAPLGEEGAGPVQELEAPVPQVDHPHRVAGDEEPRRALELPRALPARAEASRGVPSAPTVTTLAA